MCAHGGLTMECWLTDDCLRVLRQAPHAQVQPPVRRGHAGVPAVRRQGLGEYGPRQCSRGRLAGTEVSILVVLGEQEDWLVHRGFEGFKVRCSRFHLGKGPEVYERAKQKMARWELNEAVDWVNFIEGEHGQSRYRLHLTHLHIVINWLVLVVLSTPRPSLSLSHVQASTWPAASARTA